MVSKGIVEPTVLRSAIAHYMFLWLATVYALMLYMFKATPYHNKFICVFVYAISLVADKR